MEDLNKAFGICRECGAETDLIFRPRDFVIVTIPGQRPYYGRLNALKNEDGKMIAIVHRNWNETEKVDVRNISKVGD